MLTTGKVELGVQLQDVTTVQLQDITVQLHVYAQKVNRAIMRISQTVCTTIYI